MTLECQNQEPQASQNNIDPRLHQAQVLDFFDEAYERIGLTQEQIAAFEKIPLSTIQGWLARRRRIDASSQTIKFFESEEGTLLLHQVVVAATFVITLLGHGGIRLVCTFLELSGLGPFVASSYGTQQQAVKALELEVGEFADEEKARLGKEMEPKKITIVLDETFQPRICLVAKEPVSDFILLEEYADNRKQETWADNLSKALEGLPVTPTQTTSDEAPALCNLPQQSLEGANHSPDLFHVQQELFKATTISMESRVKTAKKHLDDVIKSRENLEEIDKIHPHKMTEKNIEQYRIAQKYAEFELEAAEEDQALMADEIRGISTDYHPFDLVTGKARSAALVNLELEERFAIIEELSDRAMLSEKSLERIDKAHRVVPKMVGTISFVHSEIASCLESLELPEAIENVLLEQCIPGRYVELVAAKAQTAEERKRLKAQASAILPSQDIYLSLLSQLNPEEAVVVERTIKECAEIFQRSSSCVEGRNSHLGLSHHAHHHLLPRKLKALTAVHNYFSKRRDGTTAAERFFGQKPRDLFEYLLEKTPLPKRPRSKSSQTGTFEVPLA